MTSTISAPALLSSDRARNESTWRAASIAFHTSDIEQFLSYLTDEPRYTVAYPVPGVPAVISGRDEFRQLFGGLTAAASSIEVHDVRFHQTDNPQVALVEERMVAELHNGHRYENLLVIRVTFRDGLISDMFEYYGEIAHQAMLRSLVEGA